ncbi:MAG: 3-hydroxyacyl-CoA dehydrogenase NAD-binding domain-containing protein [Actinomycetota bacterium]|nr:3-hydroxyacyl-CoA dehydrogenase NAD-binding domain-containing protein [Actinomycetota bacterium]
MTGESAKHPEIVGIVGSGTIACGLAAIAASHGPVMLCARSDESAQRASERLDGAVEVTCDPERLGDATFVVEAIVEDRVAKGELFARLNGLLAPAAILATTTSSLSVTELAGLSGRPDRFVALHVFNPVAKMELVELAFPDETAASTRARATALCQALGKKTVEVPDTPGFVVNRLLFPYLFAAVELLEETGLAPEALDTCMRLGAAHPLGPLALLDLVGLDVAAAIGEAIGAPVPARIQTLVDEGALGRKSGRGFHRY